MKYKKPTMEMICLFENKRDIITFSVGDSNYDENGNVIGGGTGSENAPDDGIF